MKKNIKIYSSEYTMYFSDVQNSRFVSFVNYFLRLHYETRSLDNKQYNWLWPEILLVGPEAGEGITPDLLDDICTRLEQEKVDILGVSVYVWNRVYFNQVCREVKKRLPHITIIGGGPELDAHKNSDFFQKHPWYDYVVYGDGEKSFTNLLDHLAGLPVELVNVVSSDGTIYPHEVFNDKETLKDSPYLKYKDEITQVIQKYRNDTFNRYKRGQSLIAIWETVKGCPYACSFCDWSSGLHNKVRFWGIEVVKDSTEPKPRPNYQLELEFFAELKFHMIQWSNPNVGLTPKDEEIIDYWCDLKKRNPDTPYSFILQLSKVKKETAHRLFKKMIAAGLEKKLKFDLQDLDPVVIDNLDRPEIPWAEHKEMIKEFVREFPVQLGYFKSKINFMWGLPGQTHQHFDYNLREATDIGFRANYFYFEMLPNSPANTPAYIEKFKIKSEIVYVSHVQIPEDITEITPAVLEMYFTEAHLVTSTYSLTRKEWFAGVIKNYIYNYYFFNVMDRQLDGLLNNFHLFDSLIDDMYAYFEETKVISVHAIHMLNSGLYVDFKRRIESIMAEIYSIEITEGMMKTVAPLGHAFSKKTGALEAPAAG